MLEVQGQDFMRTAAAKGLHPVTMQFRHALRNALIPVTTVAGIHLGNLLGGAVVVETVFGWPGMGRLALEAVIGRDFNVLLGVLLMSSLLVIVANAGIDLLQAWLDPRIQARLTWTRWSTSEAPVHDRALAGPLRPARRRNRLLACHACAIRPFCSAC